VKLDALALMRFDLIVLSCILVSFSIIVFYWIQKRLILQAIFKWNAGRNARREIDKAVSVQEMNDAIDRYYSR